MCKKTANVNCAFMVEFNSRKFLETHWCFLKLKDSMHLFLNSDYGTDIARLSLRPEFIDHMSYMNQFVLSFKRHLDVH